MTRTRVSVAISLPPDIAAALDQFCVATQCSRSEVVQVALWQYLPSPRPRRDLQAATAKRFSPSPSKPRARREPPRSKFVDMIMPDATEEEKAEANRHWFGYLNLLDRIAHEQGAQGRPPRAKRKRPCT